MKEIIDYLNANPIHATAIGAYILGMSACISIICMNIKSLRDKGDK